MVISDELFAAYAEGKTTDEESKQVRQYLKENPKELESMILLMDKDFGMPAYDKTKSVEPHRHALVKKMDKIGNGLSDIGLCAAAFAPITACAAPMVAMRGIKSDTVKIKQSSFKSRLDNLLDDIGL